MNIGGSLSSKLGFKIWRFKSGRFDLSHLGVSEKWSCSREYED
jgi:hypothetical protein